MTKYFPMAFSARLIDDLNWLRPGIEFDSCKDAIGVTYLVVDDETAQFLIEKVDLRPVEPILDIKEWSIHKALV